MTAPAPTPLEERLRAAAGIIAPTTIITALSSYYGYVTTLARFRYFGIDLATLRLSTQDLVLRSVGALFAPLAALLVAGVAASWVHDGVRRALATGSHARLLRRLGAVMAVAGGLLFLRGAIGVVVADVAAREPLGTTPLAIGAGSVLTAYGRHVVRRAGGREPHEQSALERGTRILVAGLLVLSLFWLTNSFAAAYGRGQAAADGAQLASRPRVVLDTQERLYLAHPGIAETALPRDEAQRFRYRYQGLRLLVAAGGRLLLVPDGWQRGDGVLVIPDDDAVRAQFSG